MHEVRAIQKRFVVSLQILLYARIIEIACSLSFQRKKGRKTDSMMFRGTICFFRFSDLGKKMERLIAVCSVSEIDTFLS